jgi:hypothetical protein
MAALGAKFRHSLLDIAGSRKLLQKNVGEASAFGEIIAVGLLFTNLLFSVAGSPVLARHAFQMAELCV